VCALASLVMMALMFAFDVCVNGKSQAVTSWNETGLLPYAFKTAGKAPKSMRAEHTPLQARPQRSRYA
jgi:hypothetical protein